MGWRLGGKGASGRGFADRVEEHVSIWGWASTKKRFSTGLDTGCSESAVMSGLLAAHATSQKPSLNEIIRYDHP